MTLRIVQEGSGSTRLLVLIYHLNARNDAAVAAAAGPSAFIANDTTIGSQYQDTPPLADTIAQLAPDGVTFSPVIVCGFSAGGLATARILAQGGDPDALVVADGTYASVPSQWAGWQAYANRAMDGQRTFLASYTSYMGDTSTWHVLSAIIGETLPVGPVVDRPADAPLMKTSSYWKSGNFTIYGYPTNDMPGHEYQGDVVLPMMLKQAIGGSGTLKKVLAVLGGVLAGILGMVFLSGRQR